MVDRLEGRVFVVTGATGIAAASARRLAREGSSVYVISLEGDDCETLCGGIVAEGGTAAWSAADLRDEEAATRSFGEVRTRFSRLDGLLAVAGASGRSKGDGPLHEVPLEGWEATLAANARPAFLAARESLNIMLEQPPDDSRARGSIVFVSSVLAGRPSPGLFATHAYAAAKGAIEALTRSMAAFYAPMGVRVNAVAPGLVDTPMSARAASDPASVAYAARKQPLAGGMLAPEDVAGAATFLLSDDARQVTGQVLTVDGGWTVTETAP